MTAGGLYIHFPFCRRLCFYCHFYKVPYAESLLKRTVDAFIQEIRIRAAAAPPLDTIYLGGGSPSLLPQRHLERLLDAARLHFHIPTAVETTLEANPEDLDLATLKEYRRLGINRISIGVQSFHSGDLRHLRRAHTGPTALKALRLAQLAGFDNISIDLLIGIRGQTKSSLEQNFLVARQAGIQHLSLYILEGLAGKRNKAASGRDSDFYTFSQSILPELGFSQYEVSNFARGGHYSRHNLKYWQNLPYVGIGPSAAGYLDAIDSRNIPNLDSYLGRLGQGRLPIQRKQRITPGIRRVIMGLRMKRGLPRQALAGFGEATRFLLQNGFLRKERGRIFVPEEKILILNEILVNFL